MRSTITSQGSHTNQQPGARQTLPPLVWSGPLYSKEERARRDETVWTLVQGILAPVQFVVFLVSLGLVLNFLITGNGWFAATLSVIVKTAILYTIMITGSIWEKVVFGKYLFARPFFWEDVFSMLVLVLHTAYLGAVFADLAVPGSVSPATQMAIALAAYATYVVNAVQFVWKLRMARLQGAQSTMSTEDQKEEATTRLSNTVTEFAQ